MRGAGWEDTHWLQLFNLIGLKTSGPNAVSKETVTLAHFLDVADAVAKNVEAIKTLDAQAQVRRARGRSCCCLEAGASGASLATAPVGLGTAVALARGKEWGLDERAPDGQNPGYGLLSKAGAKC
jgi:hypothetical protein